MTMYSGDEFYPDEITSGETMHPDDEKPETPDEDELIEGETESTEDETEEIQPEENDEEDQNPDEVKG
jgi:hypothetical protein